MLQKVVTSSCLGIEYSLLHEHLDNPVMKVNIIYLNLGWGKVNKVSYILTKDIGYKRWLNIISWFHKRHSVGFKMTSFNRN